eukprot:765029-Hanusia_phi.AAC.3
MPLRKTDSDQEKHLEEENLDAGENAGGETRILALLPFSCSSHPLQLLFPSSVLRNSLMLRMEQVERLRKFRHRLMSEGYLPPDPESYNNKARLPPPPFLPTSYPPPSPPLFPLPPFLLLLLLSFLLLLLLLLLCILLLFLLHPPQPPLGPPALTLQQHMKRVYDSMGMDKDELQWQLDLFARKGLKFKPDKKLRGV